MSFIGSQKKVILSYFQHPSCWVLQGPCRRVEFLDTRPNDHSSLQSSDYDVSVLNGWIDKVDRPVYAEAVRIFHEDLVKYDVSPTTCQACYEEAGLEVWPMNKLRTEKKGGKAACCWVRVFFCFGCFKEFDEEWWAMVRSGWKLLVSFWIPIIPPGSVFQDPRTRGFQQSMMRRKAAPTGGFMEPLFSRADKFKGMGNYAGDLICIVRSTNISRTCNMSISNNLVTDTSWGRCNVCCIMLYPYMPQRWLKAIARPVAPGKTFSPNRLRAAFHKKMRLLESFCFFTCLPLPLWAAYDVLDLERLGCNMMQSKPIEWISLDLSFKLRLDIGSNLSHFVSSFNRNVPNLIKFD